MIEDLGDMQTVDKWLDTGEDLSITTITTTASRVGFFLADFHLGTSPQRVEWLRVAFKNDNAKEVVFWGAIAPILRILREYHIPDAEILYDFLVDEFRASNQASEEQIFCMGDLWTGSLLVGENCEIGVIDWEFATMGAPSQDIGQLGFFHLA